MLTKSLHELRERHRRKQARQQLLGAKVQALVDLGVDLLLDICAGKVANVRLWCERLQKLRLVSIRRLGLEYEPHLCGHFMKVAVFHELFDHRVGGRVLKQLQK